MDLKQYITSVQDFPIKGVSFNDVTTLLNNGEAFHQSIQDLTERP
jgi:adenine phosphoribosyltransferase